MQITAPGMKGSLAGGNRCPSARGPLFILLIGILLFGSFPCLAIGSMEVKSSLTLQKSLFWGRPAKLAIGVSGEIFMVDPARSAVLVLDSKGQRQGIIDPSHSGGLLREPGDIRFRGEILWILDRGRGAVLGVDSNLTPLIQVPVPGEFYTHGLELSAMDLDSSGRFYVCNSSTGLVGRFDREGKPDKAYTLNASSRGLWDSPTAMGVSSAGEAMVFDWKSRRTVVLKPDGTVRMVRDGGFGSEPESSRHSRPAIVSITWGGMRFWFCNLATGGAGELQLETGDSKETRLLGDGPLSPAGLAWTDKGQLMVLDSLGPAVLDVQVQGVQSQPGEPATNLLTLKALQGRRYEIFITDAWIRDGKGQVFIRIKSSGETLPEFLSGDLFLSINGREVETFDFHQSGESAILTFDSANQGLEGCRITLLTRWRGVIRRATRRVAALHKKDHKGHGK